MTENTIQERYDVVVIGAGLGGLTAAAYLARGGRKVVVAERHDFPGGACTSFRRGDFVFQSGVLWIEGYEQVVMPILEELEIAAECPFNDVDPPFAAVFPDDVLPFPKDYTLHIEALKRRFPEQAENISRFVAAYNRVNRELETMPEKMDLRGIVSMLLKHRAALSYFRKTYDRVLDRYITDPTLRGYLAAPYCGLFGLPPEKFSAIAPSIFFVKLEKAGWTVGGMQKLPDALVAGIKRAGGTVALRTGVEKVLLEGQRARGVRLSGGREVGAGTVISAIDPRRTFHDLIGAERIAPRYLKKLGGGELSPTGFKVFLGVEMELRPPVPAATFLYLPSLEAGSYFGTSEEDVLSPDGFAFIFVPTLEDPSLAPPGCHVVEVCVLGDFYRLVADRSREDYQGFKKKVGDALIGRAEKIFPGLSDHIVVRDAATPLTWERYTGVTGGVFYGWRASPGGLARLLPRETPFENLYLCGQWVTPGGGAPPVMLGGKQLALELLSS